MYVGGYVRMYGCMYISTYIKCIYMYVFMYVCMLVFVPPGIDNQWEVHVTHYTVHSDHPYIQNGPYTDVSTSSKMTKSRTYQICTSIETH